MLLFLTTRIVLILSTQKILYKFSNTGSIDHKGAFHASEQTDWSTIGVGNVIQLGPAEPGSDVLIEAIVTGVSTVGGFCTTLANQSSSFVSLEKSLTPQPPPSKAATDELAPRRLNASSSVELEMLNLNSKLQATGLLQAYHGRLGRVVTC